MLSKKLIVISTNIILLFTINNPVYSNTKDSLTFKEATSICLNHNPELKAFIYDKKIIDSKLLNSSLLSNPEFSILSENLGGKEDVTGGSQLTVSISQKIEFGDKISARLNLINSENNINDILYKIKKIDVLNKLELSILDLFFLQEKIKLYSYFNDISNNTYITISEIVKVGKKSSIEETKAKINYFDSLKKLELLKEQISNYKESISLVLGTNKSFIYIDGDYLAIKEKISKTKLLDKIKDNPQIEIYGYKIEQLNKSIILEKIKNKPDLSLTGGYRLFDITKQGGFSLNTGLSVQMPIFNTNQETIKELELNISKLLLEKESLKNSLEIELNNKFKNYSESYNEYQIIDKKILPEAENLFELIKEGYKIGRFSYLELLDSQNSLFYYKERKLELLYNYQKSLSEINLITSNY